jgi:hypothetical protein
MERYYGRHQKCRLGSVPEIRKEQVLARPQRRDYTVMAIRDRDRDENNNK